MEEVWDLNEILARGVNAKLASPATVEEPPLPYHVVTYELETSGYLAVVYENGSLVRVQRIDHQWLQHVGVLCESVEG
jgi:hypothetical protein